MTNYPRYNSLCTDENDAEIFVSHRVRNLDDTCLGVINCYNMWGTDSEDELLCQALDEVENSLWCTDKIDDPGDLPNFPDQDSLENIDGTSEDTDDSCLEEQIMFDDEKQLGFHQNNVTEGEKVLSDIKEMVDRQFHGVSFLLLIGLLSRLGMHRASLSCPQTMRNITLGVHEETQISPKDKVHDTPRLSLQKLPGHAGDMKAEIDQTEAVFILKQLVQLAESVGLISSPSVCGTGFHVGPGYIMTAKHVVDQILQGAAIPLQQHVLLSPHHQLSNINVFIDFSYERNHPPSDDNLRFHFEPVILYANENLDTVILKLKPTTKNVFPPALTKFARLPHDECCGYFIGHSKADIKKRDKYQCVKFAPDEITAAKEWSVRHVNVDGFVGIDDPQRVLLHCSFEKGASGAPGFYINPYDGEVYVVLMLLRGYPDWYYDDKYKQETKIGIPPKCLIEQGVSMVSVYEDMKNTAPSLCKEIFEQ